MIMHYKASAAVICAIILFSHYVMSLELTKLQVPLHLPLGVRPELLCHWTLGPTDVLYSVKWYKDGKEFFRHVPKELEPLKKFRLLGVDVEEFNSSGSNLTLAPAVKESSGRYRCEISGERPLFQTVSKHADMLVLDLPSQGLTILGFESRYHVGDRVNASCISKQSNLAMKLVWYINGSSVLPADLRPAMAAKGETKLGIEFTIVKGLVGDLKLKCVLTEGSTYLWSIEKHAHVTDIIWKHPKGSQISKDSARSYPNSNSGEPAGIRRQYLLIALSFLFLYVLI